MEKLSFKKRYHLLWRLKKRCWKHPTFNQGGEKKTAKVVS